jgi:dihydrofolate synthase / folylpolyglutamate synthase
MPGGGQPPPGASHPSSPAEALLAPRMEQKIVPGLDRMRRVLEALGHPERAFPAVTIVGTNGKGSTAAMLASILGAHSAKVGLYTSPHLVRVEERIAVRGEPIPPDRLAELVRGLDRFPELSYFETLTVAAFLELAAREVDVAVLEAGLGGRWDAVNAATPVVSLLTNVGTDHQAWLGPTRNAIAAEKAGALRGREAIVGSWDDEVRQVILATAEAPISLATDWARVGSRGPGASVRFSIGDLDGEAVLPLAGDHQLANLRLALAGLAALARHAVSPALDSARIAAGIAATRWPGRLQQVEHAGRTLLLDGAHNIEAASSLVAALDAACLSGTVHLLFSCLDDKPLEGMADLFASRARTVTVAPLASPRAVDAATLARAFPGCRQAGSVAEAFGALPEGEVTLVTGSLRLVGEVLAILEGHHG